MGKTVLIVDDFSTIRGLISQELQQAGYQILEANDGVEALQVLQNALQIDLIITDLHMPKMDGIEMATQLRKSDFGKFLPVLMVTTEMQPSVQAKAKEAGVTGLLTKPFQQGQLIKAVKKLIG